MQPPITVVLHNVRSAHNVGSVFRTADASGVRHIYLTGYTPTPLDRFKRPQKEIAKTALGAETFIPWSASSSLPAALRTLREEGCHIIGVEQDVQARDYRVFKPEWPVAFVFGNEVRGLSRAARSACDELIHVSMFGKKESLNVATTAGIILFSCMPRG